MNDIPLPTVFETLQDEGRRFDPPKSIADAIQMLETIPSWRTEKDTQRDGSILYGCGISFRRAFYHSKLEHAICRAVEAWVLAQEAQR